MANTVPDGRGDGLLNAMIAAAPIDVAATIIAESTLSFLGLGFPPDIPTWGLDPLPGNTPGEARGYCAASRQGQSVSGR